MANSNMNAVSKAKNSPQYFTCTLLRFYAAGMVVYYRRFGTIYKFHLHQSKHA